MKIFFGLTLSIVASASLTQCSTPLPDVPAGGEVALPLNQVPKKIMAAAQARLPGFVADEAELENEDGRLAYDLEGTAGGVRYEIEISPDGEILEVDTEK